MRVKVHPHKSRINAGIEAAVSVTPVQRGGRAYCVGAVLLSDVQFRIHAAGLARARAEQVRNVHAWVIGNLDGEYPRRDQVDPAALAGMTPVTYHYAVGRFLTLGEESVDVTDGRFDRAVVSGRHLYVALAR